MLLSGWRVVRLCERIVLLVSHVYLPFKIDYIGAGCVEGENFEFKLFSCDENIWNIFL